jgi:hypothetical protein
MQLNLGHLPDDTTHLPVFGGEDIDHLELDYSTQKLMLC